MTSFTRFVSSDGWVGRVARSVVLLALGLPQPARADGLQLPATVPTSLALARDGWAIELSVDGELNSDARADRVVVLLQAAPDTQGERARALVVLLAQDGGYRVVGTSTHLLACFQCLGVNGGDAQPNIKIARGVLTITQAGGSREYYGAEHRFRFAPEQGKLLWIGLDSRSGDRLNGQQGVVSENFLTGRRITTITPPQVDEEGNERPRRPTRRTEKLARARLLALEEVPPPFGR